VNKRQNRFKSAGCTTSMDWNKEEMSVVLLASHKFLVLVKV